jgi:hypothetical protein
MSPPEPPARRGWPALPYEQWRPTCDTLHAHTQVLGKLAAALAPPEPELQHAALRLTARGWETMPLPAPTGGALVVALDLHAHATVAEHSDGRRRAVALAPDRSVGAVTRDVLAAVGDLVGPVPFNPVPQETAWSVPLDEDEDHASYDQAQVADYLAAATSAARVLSELRAPYRGRSTPVNAWWGSFDLAVSLFSGRPADPPVDGFIMRNAMDAQELAVGWWPGDGRHPGAAFYAYAHPAPAGFEAVDLEPAAAHWDGELGELILDWDDVRTARDPHGDALAFLRSAARHGCLLCEWDPALAGSLEGKPPPVS